METEQAPWSGTIPRLTLPAKSIDKWPTQVNLKAGGVALPGSYFMMDGLSIDQQPTLIVPTVWNSRELTKLGTQASEAEGYALLIRKLVKSSGIYAVASFVSPLIAFILSPFLTHNLSHDAYGALAVLTTIIALVA